MGLRLRLDRLSAVPRRFIQTVTIVALTFSLGGHWHVLQVAAWMKMIHQAAPEIGLAEAVAATLGGENPCRLCNGIRAAKSPKSGDEAPIPRRWDVKKLDSLVAGAQIGLKPRSDGRRLAISRFRLRIPDSLVREVPFPPPKAG